MPGTPTSYFKWGEIHLSAKSRIELLDSEIRSEISQSIEAIPAANVDRHQFFVLLRERADGWADRGLEAYMDCLRQVGRETWEYARTAVWSNGLSFFVADNIRQYLFLACGISDPRRTEIQITSAIESILFCTKVRTEQETRCYGLNWLERTKVILNDSQATTQRAGMLLGRESNGVTPLNSPKPVPNQSGLEIPQASRVTPSVSDRKDKESAPDQKAALIKKLQIAIWISTTEAALLFEVNRRTITNWLDEGKLEPGPKRATITTASAKQLLKNKQ